MVKMGQKLSKEQKLQNKLRRRKLQYAKTLTKRPRKARKVKKPRVVPLSKLVKKADRLLSLFIRARDKKCVLCGSTINLTNGHLIKRGKKPVRWDENNCFCLCSTCNFRDKVDTNYHGRYVAWFIGRYGLALYEDLERRAEIPVPTIWIREKCLQVIKQYE